MFIKKRFCPHSLFRDSCVTCSISHTKTSFTIDSINEKSPTNSSIIIDEPIIVDKLIIMDNAFSGDYSIIDKLTTNKNFNTNLYMRGNLACGKKIIFAVDNDECIGSWGDLSLLYIMLKIELGCEPDINLFVDIMVKTGCIRPYVKDFFDKLLELKRKGIIYKIFMFTAASNSNGWVIFLSKILEKWIGQPFYDGVIYKEMIEEWHTLNNTDFSNDLGYIKNMNMLREIIEFKDDINSQHFHFIAIDDRPANIINGTAIGVTPFRVAINIMEVLRLYLPEDFNYLMGKYDKIINNSWENYLKNPHIFTITSRDTDFLSSLDHINKIIFS